VPLADGGSCPFRWNRALERYWTGDVAGGREIVRRVWEGFQAAMERGASGVAVEVNLAIVYEVDGGRVVRMRNYLDHDEALEAAGLSE
jgi:hypothetical protein